MDKFASFLFLVCKTMRIVVQFAGWNVNLGSSERSGVTRTDGVAKKTDRVWLGEQRKAPTPPGSQE